MIRTAALVLACLALAVSAARAQAPLVPLPADVTVEAVGADVPPELACFAGVWAGDAWDGVRPHVLVVERVVADGRVVVVYAVGESAEWNVTPRHFRTTGRIEHGVLGLVLRDARVQYRLDAGRLRGRFTSSAGTRHISLSPATLAEVAATPAVASAAVPPSETVRIPTAESPLTLEATLYRPAGEGPFPVVVFNHGSTGDVPTAVKLTLKPARQARFFMERGFAVLAPMRRGRGASDGDYGEAYGCETAGLSNGLGRAIQDLDAVLAWLGTQAWADPGRLLMAGISRGGILSAVYAGERPRKVRGVVNFAGGWTGDQCDLLNRASFNMARFGEAGRATPTPMLWLYGDGDPFYTAASIRSYYDAFTAAGGRGALHVYRGEGHGIAKRTELWGATADAFLAGAGLMPGR